MLPQSLLDLTLLRISTGLNKKLASAMPRSRAMQSVALLRPRDQRPARKTTRASRVRRKPQALTADHPPPAGVPVAVSELERRVQILQDAAEAEETGLHSPSYTEGELMTFYENVLEIPNPEVRMIKKAPSPLLEHDRHSDNRIVATVDERLGVAQDSESLALDDNSHSTERAYRRALMKAHRVLSRLEVVRDSTVGTASSSSQCVPVSVLSQKEGGALVRVCIRNRDVEAAYSALELMKRTAMPLPSTLVEGVMEMTARNGDVQGTEYIISKYLSAFPSEQQRHLHIQSHIAAGTPETIPVSALNLLHSYEQQSHPAPMKTYATLITRLLSTNLSIGRAQAWDLYSHMRFVAHPNPDALLYTLMIRACASPVSASRSSEPERALDLWTEMTVDHKISPTLGAYSAVILACAKAGTKTYVNEAFRLAKEMLDSHRDAHGKPAFLPDRRVYCALLEGAKRVGDLARARWILAEMVKTSRHRPDNAEPMKPMVDEEVMMHVFHAYASYRPPFRRADTVLIQDTPQQSAGQTVVQNENNSLSSDALEAGSGNGPSFTHLPPQSGAEVINEVKALFERVLYDNGLLDGDEPQADVLPTDKAFANVNLSTRFINSYLSVYYRHASLAEARALYSSLFGKFGVERSSRTYVEALERCVASRRGQERVDAMEFANEIWDGWNAYENSQPDVTHSMTARYIERAHIARIKIFALTNDLPQAMSHVRQFADRYPASKIRVSLPKPALRSTRTVLEGAARPLVRLTASSDVPDDHVPPLLTFGDLELLHHRLVVAGGMGKEIAYLKYISKAYEWALRVRRDETMKARPQEGPVVVHAVG